MNESIPAQGDWKSLAQRYIEEILAKLGPDWDSYGASPINRHCIDVALSFTEHPYYSGWSIGPTNSGGIVISKDFQNYCEGTAPYIEVEINPENVETFGSFRDGRYDGKEGFSLQFTAPEECRIWFESFLASTLSYTVK